MALPGRPITIDYRISTAKLREAALSGKPQSRRNYRNVKSAPPFQNRTLDNYPMSQGREDVTRCTTSRKQTRRDFIENIHQNEAESLSLKTYSKQMFETAVKTVRQHDYQSLGSNRKCNTRTTGYGAKQRRAIENGRQSTGPTHDGSILYNQKQWMLNSIRLRPHSQPVTQNGKGRTNGHPSINSTIKDKNQNYILRSTGGISRAGSTSTAASISGASIYTDTSDFIFVPVCDGHEQEYKRHGSLDTQTMSDYSGSCDNDGDRLSDVDELDFKPFVNQVQPPARMLPPSLNRGIHLVSLDEESSTESEDEDEESRPLSDPALETSTKPPDTGKTIEHKVPQPPADETLTGKVKLQLKGPHCWVDDATVSTDISDNAGDLDDIDSVNSAQKQPDIGSRKGSASLKRMNSQSDLKESAGKGPPPLRQRSSQKELQEPKVKDVQAIPIKEEEDEDDDDAVFVNLSEVQECHLPAFICPSSERKSREAAIKDWLATTCFQSGSRCVPLL